MRLVKNRSIDPLSIAFFFFGGFFWEFFERWEGV